MCASFEYKQRLAGTVAFCDAWLDRRTDAQIHSLRLEPAQIAFLKKCETHQPKKGDLQMNKKLLKLLNKDSRTPPAELAVMLGISEQEVRDEIAALEREGVIRGYKAVIDWDKLDSAYVSAIIELKVTPKAGLGFEDVAARVMKYPEVESVYLMSGVYDLNVVVKGKTFQEVAKFVAKELSTIDSVTSTATHFVLRRYKELDVELLGDDRDERGSYLL